MFFSCQLHVGFYFYHIPLQDFFHTHTYVLLILLYHLYLAIYLCHSCRTIKLYTSSVMNIYINKLIYTGAEEGVEVVECPELDLIS